MPDPITATPTVVTQRPLLLLDVDGVLDILRGPHRPPGLLHAICNTYEITYRREVAEWLKALSVVFDLVWATTWEASANYWFGPLFDLPELPVCELPIIREVRAGTGFMVVPETWKLRDIQAYVGDRAFAWIDDMIGPDGFYWAKHRDVPTLFVRTSKDVGMTERHVVDLLAWAGMVTNYLVAPKEPRPNVAP